MRPPGGETGLAAAPTAGACAPGSPAKVPASEPEPDQHPAEPGAAIPEPAEPAVPQAPVPEPAVAAVPVADGPIEPAAVERRVVEGRRDRPVVAGRRVPVPAAVERRVGAGVDRGGVDWRAAVVRPVPAAVRQAVPPVPAPVPAAVVAAVAVPAVPEAAGFGGRAGEGEGGGRGRGRSGRGGRRSSVRCGGGKRLCRPSSGRDGSGVNHRVSPTPPVARGTNPKRQRGPRRSRGGGPRAAPVVQISSNSDCVRTIVRLSA